MFALVACGAVQRGDLGVRVRRADQLVDLLSLRREALLVLGLTAEVRPP